MYFLLLTDYDSNMHETAGIEIFSYTELSVAVVSSVLLQNLTYAFTKSALAQYKHKPSVLLTHNFP